MSSCFNSPTNLITEEGDSPILYSTTSDSPDRSTSSSFCLSIPSASYNLNVTNLSFTVIPSTSCILPWQANPNPINVLKSVSFQARSSEILAIVGPSGTGKSTLLKFIAGRVTDSEFDPKAVAINNRVISAPSQLRKICGFVPQEDNLLPLLTVRETLTYSAKFCLRELTLKEKQEKVEGLLSELGLVHVANSFVGDEDVRGISGGERKRVSIGVDMISDPQIIILDEPTSGLDSSSALQVIQQLSSIARVKQRTIVISIHQPSYRILELIPNLLILSSGTVVHNGSLQSLEDSIGDLGFQIPQQLNPIEFAMEIIQYLEDSAKSQSPILIPPELDTTTTSIWQEEAKTKSIIDFSEIGNLCSRSWKIIYRTKQLLAARTMQAVIGGFLLGSVYIDVKKDDGGITQRLGLFAFSLSLLLSSTVEALPIYLQERRVLMKESSRGSYKISSYIIANTIVFLPFLLVVAILFSVPVYWLVGLTPSASAFAFFTFTVWLIVLMASSLVMFLSSISPNFIVGNSLICAVLGAFFLFSGYFIPKDKIPKYWIFMYYLSLYRYPLDSLLTNEYWGMREDCFRWLPAVGGDDGGGRRCLLTGNDVLKSSGLERDPRWENVGIMVGFFVLYRFLCWVILVRKASRTTI
ncbi:ABC transporter G family member 23 [Linum grandiflorum]